MRTTKPPTTAPAMAPALGCGAEDVLGGMVAVGPVTVGPVTAGAETNIESSARLSHSGSRFVLSRD